MSTEKYVYWPNSPTRVSIEALEIVKKVFRDLTLHWEEVNPP